ncbi:response regulator [Oscillatoriales cyanobacterium LEGE 11467]|uniref:Response regulator n=1 Tax=Zarconia navalis LEGE 11467 TaxID=1828826 RepID=A0A928VZL5_9CYAN|nr:response regulator [Zarconia navalis]MBE9040580.1 response regulator [Zarconia navalis LEGE 11467]
MKSVFVVEDGHTEQAMIKALLGQAGFVVSVASNVDEAWNWLQNNALPNLIVLDIVMPGKSGLELCRMIQEHDKMKDVPIVFCSSKSEEFDRFWALRQGAKAYVVKPYAPKELLDTVFTHIQ